MSEIVSIPSDGAVLSGTLYRPEGDVIAALVIHPAVGVPQHLYTAFSEWAASQGRLCLTYDYRDVGASATGRLRDSKADFVDWGVKDQAAALSFVQAMAPSSPLHVIGHSLGGFMTPFHDRSSDIAAMTTVASGQAFKGDHPMPFRLSAYLFWYVLGPMMTRILGYTPGALLGGGDIPASAFWQWRRWCTRLAFYSPDIGTILPAFAQPGLSAPLKITAFTDDALMPPKSVAKLAQRYPNADVTEVVIDPKKHGLREIGHMKAFSRANSAIWPEILPG